VSEVSFRIWLDDALWETLRRRAVAERVTARDLIPRLLAQTAAGSRPAPAAAAPARMGATGLPIVPLAEQYECGVCGATLRLGAVSQHVNKHLREHQAATGSEATEGS